VRERRLSNLVEPALSEEAERIPAGAIRGRGSLSRIATDLSLRSPPLVADSGAENIPLALTYRFVVNVMRNRVQQTRDAVQSPMLHIIALG